MNINLQLKPLITLTTSLVFSLVLTGCEGGGSASSADTPDPSPPPVTVLPDISVPDTDTEETLPPDKPVPPPTTETVTPEIPKPLPVPENNVVPVAPIVPIVPPPQEIVLTPFNLQRISAFEVRDYHEAEGIRRATFAWDDALANGSTVDVTYTVCEKSLVEDNSCKALGSVKNSLTADIDIGSLIDAIANDYFVMATVGTQVLSSSERSVELSEIYKMLGHFKGANSAEGDWFGSAVSISTDGKTLAVSAPGESSSGNRVVNGISGGIDNISNAKSESGAVYLFSNESGEWKQITFIKASNSDVGDRFGHSLALSGDGKTLAVGAIKEASNSTGVYTDHAGGNNNGALGSGAVYVYDTNGTLWSQIAYIKASNTDAGDWFGNAVSLDFNGSTLAVGAPMESSNFSGFIDPSRPDNNNLQNSGAVYLYEKQPDGWAQTHYVKASNSDKNDQFGFSLALSDDGESLAVGAKGESSGHPGISANGDGEHDNTSGGAGAVYMYSKAGSNWEQAAYVKPSTTEDGGNFGYSLDLNADGTSLVVGATQLHTSSPESGVVYTFENKGTGWEETGSIKPSNGGNNDQFGSSVAVTSSGDKIIVGALGEDSSFSGITSDVSLGGDDGRKNSGAAYLFTKDGNQNWQQSAYIKPFLSEANPPGGEISVAIDGDGSTIVVGGALEDNGCRIVSSGTPLCAESENSGAVVLY
ncbi:FG-GAP repeat protein [Vibrio sp. HN007]|uniref:FG-GAP repeat protein n=1 Tax=Vibrio iocasae TaxID=3098914 RepID=UPI0035D496A0